MKLLSFRQLRVLFGLFAILLMAMSSFSPLASVHASPLGSLLQASEPPANQVVVKLKSGVSINTILARYNATLVDSLLENKVYILQLANGQTVDQIMPSLSADADLVNPDANHTYPITTSSVEQNYYADTAPDG